MQRKSVSLSKLSRFLDKFKETFAFKSHKHSLTDISNYTIDSSLSSTSSNPVQNSAVTAKFDELHNVVSHKVQIITWGDDD